MTPNSVLGAWWWLRKHQRAHMGKVGGKGGDSPSLRVYPYLITYPYLLFPPLASPKKPCDETTRRKLHELYETYSRNTVLRS